MAISAPSVWQIQPSGLENNGTVFDAAFGGTDYSQQDAAQLSLLTDGTCSTLNATFSSVTGGFTAAMVGNGIGIVQGGTYRGIRQIIAFVDTNTVTVDANGPVTAGNCEFRVGGAGKLASNGFIFESQKVPGNKVWIKGPGAAAGDYLIGTNSPTLSVNGTNVNPITTEGYTTTRGDGGRPTIRHNASSINCLTVTGNHQIVKNLILDASTGGVFGLAASGANNSYISLVCQNQAPCRVTTSGAQTFRRCRFTSSNNSDPGCEVQVANCHFYECEFDNNTGFGVDIDDVTWFDNCIFHANTLDGIGYADAGDDFGFHLTNCIVWNNSRDGVRISSTASDGGLGNVVIRKCIFGKHASGYDINYTVSDISANTGVIQWAANCLDCNAFYTTGTGKMHFLPANSGDITLTVSPFTSDTDFTLNETTGGGALVRTSNCSTAFPDGVNTGSYPIGALGSPSTTSGTSGGIRSLWRELTNEKDTAVVPDSTVDVYLDGGLQALNRRTGYHITTDTTSVVFLSGTQEYTLPTDVIELLWIEHNGVRLSKTDVETLNRRETDWRGAAAGLPLYWMHEGNRLIFYPKPDAAAVAADASPTLRYISSPGSFTTVGAAQLATQDTRIPVYYGVAEWASAHPDSALAVHRAQAFMKMFSEEATGILDYYRRRQLER